MSSDLKQELDRDLSELIREYEKRGLASDDISDSMFWHSELARSRCRDSEEEVNC